MSTPLKSNRREFLSRTAAVTSAVAAPWIVSPKVFGANYVAPSEKIALGVIGIGPRCTYDLKAMLKLDDVQCVAIADVQSSRRDAGAHGFGLGSALYRPGMGAAEVGERAKRFADTWASIADG